MTALSVNSDSTVVRHDDDIISLGPNDFKNLLKDTELCILCAKPNKKNREHVIPDWLLKRHNLYASRMILPKGHSHPFSTYTIPLCTICNKTLGKELETPVSIAFKEGFASVKALVDSGDPRLYAWLCFLKFKTHYKDMFLRANLDRRMGDEKLGDGLAWEKLRQEHTIARSFIFGGRLMPTAIGSMAVFRVDVTEDLESFTYYDEYDFSCSLVRDHETALICSFNDLSSANALLQPLLPQGPITFFQLVATFSEFETAVRRMYGEWRLETEFNPANGSYLIENVIYDVIGYRPVTESFRRSGLRYIFEQAFRGFGQAEPNYEDLLNSIVAGKLPEIEAVLVQPLTPSVYMTP